MDAKLEDYIFTATPEEVATRLNVTVEELKAGAERFAEFMGQSKKNFRAGWSRWKSGSSNMPMKVESYIAHKYGLDEQWNPCPERVIDLDTIISGVRGVEE